MIGRPAQASCAAVGSGSRAACSPLVGLDHAVDAVVLDVLGVGEGHDLADQADRDDLDAEHDHQRAQHQGRPVDQRHAEEQARDDEPGGEQAADREHGEAEAAEEAERLPQEAEQEVDGDDVEQQAGVEPQRARATRCRGRTAGRSSSRTAKPCAWASSGRKRYWLP